MVETVTPGLPGATPVPAVDPAIASTTPVVPTPEAPDAATPEAAAPEVEGSEPARDPVTGRFSKRQEQLSRQSGDLVGTKRTLQREVSVLEQRAEALQTSLRQQPANWDQMTYEQQQAHQVNRAIKADRLEQTIDEHKAITGQAAQTTAAVFYAKVEAARERIPDLDQAIHAFGSIPLSNLACEELAESEKAPEIANWLVRNPAEARRIVSLPPHRQVAEIARLEGRLTSVPTKRISQAPPPPQTVSGGAGTSGIDLNTADMATYMRARMGQ